MSESCHPKLPCTCPNPSEIIDYVKNKIERCIREYMNLEETVTYLQEKHKINHHLTKLIWKQLERESPEFFNKYKLSLEMTRHIKMFNSLLAKQVAMMMECGDVNICSGSSAILEFLSEDPEGSRLLNKLAYPKASPSSLPLADHTNVPIVNQLQIPTDQQNQVHPYQWSTTNGFTASTVASATTAQWSPPSNNPAYIGASIIAQAATMPQQDPSTSAFGGDIGYDDLDFTDSDFQQLEMEFQNGQHLPQLQLPDEQQPPLQYGVMQSENQLQYQPQFQLQQPFLLEEPPRLLQYGGSNNGIQQRGNNIGVMQSENQLQYLPQLLEELTPQYGETNNWMQNGGSNNGLLGAIPGSASFNNPSNGNGTLTMAQNQHDLQRQHGLVGL